MDTQNEPEVFSYTYSAGQQDEIRAIRQKYLPPEEEADKMEQLRRLDRSVTQKGRISALTVGVLGTLLFGVGMCCTMVWDGVWFIPGIVVSILGIAAVSLAYPLYLRTTNKERARIAPEVLRLTDELMK